MNVLEAFVGLLRSTCELSRLTGALYVWLRIYLYCVRHLVCTKGLRARLCVYKRILEIGIDPSILTGAE
jgi:hypothetical protein